MSYAAFLDRRAQNNARHGFAPRWVPDWLFPFQRDLVTWAVERGRAAIFADCGLGKTPMQLVWAQNVAEHTNRPVLIVAPLAVSHQVAREAQKFGLSCPRLPGPFAGESGRLYVTNYERLHLLNPADFAGVVCDESSILKNFDGVRRGEVQEFARTLPYRLLCTATAAPNDFTELGTSSEALGEMGHLDMLMRFFKNDQNAQHTVRTWSGSTWRFKRHAEDPFWRWVCGWARALRRPSDLGYPDGDYILPPIHEVEHLVEARTVREGWLFDLPAADLREQREEQRRTTRERCEVVASLTADADAAMVWCHTNEEAATLQRLIPDALEVSGRHSDDVKEERLIAFQSGEARVLITKPKIGAWGLNLQRCARVTWFPSHSYEQYYQAVRRCWRFGQAREVRVDVITTPGQAGVLKNLRRKAEQSDRMFAALVAHMHDALRLSRSASPTTPVEVPSWL